MQKAAYWQLFLCLLFGAVNHRCDGPLSVIVRGKVKHRHGLEGFQQADLTRIVASGAQRVGDRRKPHLFIHAQCRV